MDSDSFLETDKSGYAVKKTDVLILGAGLAGLSTAYHLRNSKKKVDCLVVEKNDRVGGRAGTEEDNGFLYDHTGHLLHVHDPYAKKLILRLLRGNLALHQRSNAIYYRGGVTRYPFQANTYGLPGDVVADCVAGFAHNLYRPRKQSLQPSFEEWCRSAFGEGISKHFMIPYNYKLWQTALSKMTTEWQGRFLPQPKAEEVLYGALKEQKKFFGYNAHFRYPIRGGCQSLPDALAAESGEIYLKSPVRSVDLREKVAVIDGLGEVRYRRLVNTLPLTSFLDLVTPLPAGVKAARKSLRYVTVHNLNLGVKRANISDKHWLYFPEKKYPFYRVGFYSNFSKRMVPPGCSSMYIEVSRLPGRRENLKALEKQCMEGLRRCGILKKSDRIASRLWIPIECAYVVYDRARTPALNTIFPFLSSKGVSSIGRWGEWKYSFMEETLLDGRRCADSLLGRKIKKERRSSTPLIALK